MGLCVLEGSRLNGCRVRQLYREIMSAESQSEAAYQTAEEA